MIHEDLRSVVLPDVRRWCSHSSSSSEYPVHRRIACLIASQFIEGLETRQFLSATPVFNATVAVDRLVVRADLLHFESDIFANDAKLLVDTQNLKKNLAKGDTSLKAPFAQLHADANKIRA